MGPAGEGLRLARGYLHAYHTRLRFSSTLLCTAPSRCPLSTPQSPAAALRAPLQCWAELRFPPLTAALRPAY